MNYYERARKLATINTEPTMTDQSQADETNINVIVGRFLKTGHAPGAPGEPLYGDFTELPKDLRGFIETAREINSLKTKLPPQLQNKPMDELLALDLEKINAILTPPDKPSDDQKDTPK